jgi:hypothetical protein
MSNVVTLKTTDFNSEVKKILIENDLDFKIIKLPLKAVYGAVNLNTDLFALYNTRTRKIISTCKDGYGVYQNDEFIKDVLVSLSNNYEGVSFEKAWSINDGKRIVIQLKLDAGEMINGEIISKHILLTDSNDGSTSLGVGVGTFGMETDGVFYSFMNSTNTRKRNGNSNKLRNELINNLIKVGLNEVDELTKIYSNLSSSISTKTTVDDFVKKVYGISRNSSLNELNKSTTKKLNNMDILYGYIDESIQIKGHNKYAVFCGLINFNTHKLQMFKHTSGKIASLTSGDSYKMNKLGLDFLINNK